MKKRIIWALTAALVLGGCEAASVKESDAGSTDLGTTPVKSTHKIYVFDTLGFTKLDKDGNAPGFNLQWSPRLGANLETTHWSNATPAPVVVNRQWAVTNGLTNLLRLYRLKKP